MSELPEPKDGVDYYIDHWYIYTVSIDIEVNGLKGRDSDADICSRAVEGVIDGTLDGNSTTVHSEFVKEVKLDFKTDLPFNTNEWTKEKLQELGLNEYGDLLRAGDKKRPQTETTLKRFT